jgi:hypothetical protein
MDTQPLSLVAAALNAPSLFVYSIERKERAISHRFVREPSKRTKGDFLQLHIKVPIFKAQGVFKIKDLLYLQMLR